MYKSKRNESSKDSAKIADFFYVKNTPAACCRGVLNVKGVTPEGAGANRYASKIVVETSSLW